MHRVPTSLVLTEMYENFENMQKFRCYSGLFVVSVEACASGILLVWLW